MVMRCSLVLWTLLLRRFSLLKKTGRFVSRSHSECALPKTRLPNRWVFSQETGFQISRGYTKPFYQREIQTSPGECHFLTCNRFYLQINLDGCVTENDHNLTSKWFWFVITVTVSHFIWSGSEAADILVDLSLSWSRTTCTLHAHRLNQAKQLVSVVRYHEYTKII